MNQQELGEKQNRRLRKKEEKRQQKSVAKRKQLLKQSLQAGIVLILLGAGVFFIVQFAKNSQPQGDDLSIPYPSQGSEHISPGTPHGAYNSNPPTSGWHYTNPSSENVFTSEGTDEQFIHNLEHGNVWISYRPGIDEAVIKQLESFTSSWVLMSPRSKNETDVALAAWTRLDVFGLNGKPLDTARIDDFIKRYQNKGPESIPMFNVAGGHSIR